MRITLQRAVTAALLTYCLTLAAQEQGAWRAASKTAQSITGDIALSTEKIAINFSTFTVAQIRSLQKSEISAIFDADVNAPGSGSLYRLNIPGQKKFLHHNTLCGTEDTQWMVTYVSSRTLQLAFFSGEKPPLLTIDAMQNATDLCGTYTYVK